MLCRRLPHDHHHHITTRYLTIRANSCNGCDLIHYVDGIFYIERPWITQARGASDFGEISCFQLRTPFVGSFFFLQVMDMVCTGGPKTGQERGSKKPLAPTGSFSIRDKGLVPCFLINSAGLNHSCHQKAYIFVCTWRPAPRFGTAPTEFGAHTRAQGTGISPCAGLAAPASPTLCGM